MSAEIQQIIFSYCQWQDCSHQGLQGIVLLCSPTQNVQRLDIIKILKVHSLLTAVVVWMRWPQSLWHWNTWSSHWWRYLWRLRGMALRNKVCHRGCTLCGPKVCTIPNSLSDSCLCSQLLLPSQRLPGAYHASHCDTDGLYPSGPVSSK